MRLFLILWVLIACAHASGFEKTQIVRLSEKVTVIMETQEFVQDKHKLFYCEPQKICLIDGYPVFGTEGSIPKSEIISLVLNLDGKSITLNHRGMYNPWSPIEGKPLHLYIKDDSPNGLRVRGEFSDGAATYVVEWLVLGGGAARVQIDCIECTSPAYSPAVKR